MAHLQVAHAIGWNPSVPATGGDFVQPGGQYFWPKTPGDITVYSDSPDDATGGDGAWYAFVFAVDFNYRHTPLLVPLNGTTPVEITRPQQHQNGPPSGWALRINGVICQQAGDAGVNVGNIFVEIDGNVCQIASAGYGRSQQMNFTTTLQTDIMRLWAEVLSDQPDTSATVLTYNRPPGQGTCWQVLDRMLVSPDNERNFQALGNAGDTQAGLLFPQGTDFMMVIESASLNNLSMVAGITLLQGEFSYLGQQV